MHPGSPDDAPVTLARADTPAGEVALRSRGNVVELIVNGVFAMDSVETASEIALADAAGRPPGRVLVGGLGLGYTASALLDNGATSVDVVDLAEPLLDWARAGVTERLGRVASDPRVRLHAGDIAAWASPESAPTRGGPWDAVLLDVDNGPGFLIHDANERVYSADALGAFAGRLAAGGVLVVWSESPSPPLWAALRTLDAAAEEILVPVERDGRRFAYALYRARRPA